MSTRNGTTDAIRLCFAQAEDLLSIRELLAALRDAGAEDVTEKQVRSIVYQREQAGEFLKSTRDQVAVYGLNPDFERPARGMAPTTAALAPTLGAGPAAHVGAESANKRPPLDLALDVEDAVHDLFRDRLSTDTRYTARDIAEELGGRWRTGEVAIACYSGVQQGWLHMEHSAEENDNVFWLVDAGHDDAHAAAAAAMAGEPLPPFSGCELREAPPIGTARTAVAAIPGIGDVEPLTRAPAPLLPLGLSDRLAAIVADLEDAIGDACDGELPHPVIKALVVANGATQRALRSLAA